MLNYQINAKNAQVHVESNPRENSFTLALLVLLVTNITSVPFRIHKKKQSKMTGRELEIGKKR